MRAGQRKFSVLGVIERRAEPARRVVANLALLRETSLHVIRIRGCREVFGMATVAIRGSAFIFPANVTCAAFECGVSARQGEARKFQVIEFGAEPGVGGVARFASCGKGGSVIGLCGVLKIGDMAAQAGCR